jgi:hypothetical protein
MLPWRKTAQALLQIASAYAYERHVTPECITLPCPDQPPRSPAEMKTAEELFRVYDLYLWLYDRLGAPGVFRGRRQVLRQRQQVGELIDIALQKMGGVRTHTQQVATADDYASGVMKLSLRSARQRQ